MANSLEELRVVLLGKTGNGKSATGNSLLSSRNSFHSTQSARSITRNCEVKSGTCTTTNGQKKKLLVVDTPGFFDTDTTITNEKVQRTIASQIFNMTSPGVHAFLIVVRIDRFTPEEKQTVDFIKKIFGPDAAKYCIVILTREDQLEDGQTIDEFINTSADLKELVTLCGNRKLAINNKLMGELLERKIKYLIQIIDQMVENNGRSYYTNEEYQRIERQRKEEQAKREEEERKKKEKYEELLKEQAREEERQKAKKREQEIREEEQQKARRREQEIRDEEQRRASACQSRRRYDDDDDYPNFLSHALGQMRLGNCGMGFQPPMSSQSTMLGGRSGGGGRFTGEFVSSRGSANNQPIMEGSRGGRFYWNSNGNKTYLRKS